MNNNTQLSNLLRVLLPIIIVAAFIVIYLPYRRDIRNAYAHLDSIERQVVQTECGPVEVAIQGEGEPVLVIHGIAGGSDQGLELAKAYLGDGYKIIAPSRFGYLGTPMPADATPASQADTFVCLLDALNLEQIVVVADSAGGTSAIQMALHHPERLRALILVSSAAPTVGEYITLPPKPIIQFVFGSDFLMWVITTHFQSMMQPAVGIPEGYQLSEAEQVIVSGTIRSILPIKPRTDGFVFDMFTSNVDMDRHPDEYPMEEIRVPVLVIHAVDDSLAKYENARALAARIPNAELLSIPSGGHLLLGMGQTVRSGTARFLHSLPNLTMSD
jgi:pimeloyl-ACP methyl ester carboxylesterase